MKIDSGETETEALSNSIARKRPNGPGHPKDIGSWNNRKGPNPRFPVVTVRKIYCGYKFCMIFRAVNKIAESIANPPPLIDDILALLGKATYFSTFDLRSGYWGVAMEEEHLQQAAFGCHLGLYQFRVMPFGLSMALGVMQQLMSVFLSKLEEFAMAYIDYILVFSRDPSKYFCHLQLVFDRVKQQSLKLKLLKSQFVRDETNQLAFVINKKRGKPDTEKVEVIRSMQKPQSVREARGFIGVVGYPRGIRLLGVNKLLLLY